MGLQILLQTMFSIGTADTRFTPSGMKTLHRFEVFTVNIGFAELQLSQC